MATLGLVLTIVGFSRHAPAQAGITVGAYIVGVYGFTASPSFANQAVTTTRALTNTFAGIQPSDAGSLLAAQLIGAALALFAVALVGFGQRILSA